MLRLDAISSPAVLGADVSPLVPWQRRQKRPESSAALKSGADLVKMLHLCQCFSRVEAALSDQP